jgi:precorrin-8X/cobalt-precorrin-8 methylmutase
VTWQDQLYGDRLASGQDMADDEEIRILRSLVDLGGLPRVSRAVAEQVMLASADLCYAAELVLSEPWLEAAVSALAAGAPVIADSTVTAAAISDCVPICKADEPLTRRLARTAGIDLAAAAVRLAVGDAGPGAIWVVGSAPVAIHEIISRGALPALVIGMPAGFSAAVEAKKVLRGSGMPALTNTGEKGGPAVAAAACMALLQQAGVRASAS